MFFTFNGISSTDPNFGITSVTSVIRQLLPAVRDRSLEIAGRPGIWDFGRDLSAGSIRVTFVVVGATRAELRAKTRNIAQWLNQGMVKPLIFSDEVDKQYLARVASEVSITETGSTAFCHVTFMIPDFYASALPPDTSVAVNVPAINGGTIDTDLRIQLLQTVANIPNLTITLQPTGDFIRILTEILVGDSISIASANRTAELTRGAVLIDLSRHISIESTFFKLPVGSFTVQTSSANTTGNVFFRRRYA
jgi:predicted phage tail component-like protein